MSDQSGQNFIPANVTPLTFEKFAGLNTKASRNGIDDQQMSWVDGWMPLGANNLRTLPDVGPSIYDTDGPQIVWMYFGNIGATPYAVLARTDGSVLAVNTNTKAVSTILPAGTIQSPTPNTIGMTQWGNQYLIIVTSQPNGFFVWDGSNLFQTGTLGPDVTIDNNGVGYTSPPTITAVGGNSSGATFVGEVRNGGVVQITVTNPGTGYLSTDNVILAFSGGGAEGSTAILQPVVDSGTISSVNILNAGTGYVSPTGTVLDSTGLGATVSITATSGTISTVSVVDAGSGYSNFPVILVQDPSNPVAVATVDVMPDGVQGTTAETYSSRLFIGNGNQAQISAPDSLVDFAASDGGDEFKSTDSFLRVAWSKFQQSNGFIYLIADSSVNYISGIQTAGSPLVTTFTNQNADPEIGTPYQPTAGVFGENIILANSFGVHQGYGGQFIKTSDALDGIYTTVPNFNGITPSAAKAIIFGRKVWMLLLPIINPLTGVQEDKLLMTDGKIWWTSSQSVDLIFIASQEINSVLTAYGTDGTSVYPLFQVPSIAFKKTVQTKLWDAPGGYLVGKTANRLWGAVNYYDPSSPEIDIAVDNETGSNSTTPTIVFATVTITNINGAPVTVVNASGDPVTIGGAGSGISIFQPLGNFGQQGVLLGMTISTNCADVALISVSLGAVVDHYRG